ncbi:hypothetical protein H9623_07135 [Oerskovia sp. Sa1BUA8]|uniref:Uncharacterized protein n=1 Tax=Oerskovia douganii TaxID=2762210 RepID=A0A9D5U942_9CELL|nr:hypothetical protein [Oerskovia douganii]MBE7700079.1 hypothetical protein [Oerskovia douganii]
MSTVPGTESWRDAGLVTPDDDDPKNLVEEELTPPATPSGTDDPEDYSPRTPRPDLDGEADEADVVEQAAVVPLDEGGDGDGAAEGE